jgi:hypothetical protein
MIFLLPMIVEVNHDSGRLAMFRFFLFVACVMAANMSVAGEVSPCSNTVPIQIMTPGHGGSGIKTSAAEISSSLPHFRAFVTDVTNHIDARLARDKLCINSAGSTDDMKSAKRENRSLLQFMYWPLSMHDDFLVPVMPSYLPSLQPLDRPRR